jgi:hypothetical protein
MNKCNELSKKKMEIFYLYSKTESLNESFLPNLTYKLNANPTKTSANYFVDTDKLILSLYGEAKDPELKNKSGRQTLPNCKA